ncbi:MAG: phage terminase large subunit family protein, partial [Pseudomonadota bacterium]
YQRGIMDAASDPRAHTVVIMSSAQVGKTEIVNNVAGFYIDQDPAPVLVLQPTLDMGKAWSKDRLAPMLRDTPTLQGKVTDVKARDSGNTVMHKSFPGGHITIAGANSPASLASRPIRVLLADEVDRYPESAGTEGDPISLAEKRTTTFWNRKRIYTSTPTIKNVEDERGELTGGSRIERLYENSDKRKFYVPCPHCGEHQTLIWSQVKWPKGTPEEAEYACIECGALWSDVDRARAVGRGEWRSEAPFRGVAGFHLNELYSPWVKLAETAAAFLEARASRETLQVWTNTALGETWEESGEKVDAGELAALRQVYDPDTLPEEVLFATAGVDVQKDRLELERVAWGPGEENWGVRYDVLEGDPAQQEVWDDLDAVLLEPMHTVSGRPVRVAAAAIDTGGHFASQVYAFCEGKRGRRVWPIKGQAGAGVPIWPTYSSKAAKGKRSVWMVGVDTAKEMIYSRWEIAEGDGACHLPSDPALGYDETWMKQATAEQKLTRYTKGRAYIFWDLKPGQRNEALDCRVYATAAMRSLPRRMRMRESVRVEPHAPSGELIRENAPLRPNQHSKVSVKHSRFKKKSWLNAR